MKLLKTLWKSWKTGWFSTIHNLILFVFRPEEGVCAGFCPKRPPGGGKFSTMGVRPGIFRVVSR